MRNLFLYKYLSTLQLSKTYLGLALLYGISTLIVPFTTQMLVNELAITGLWLGALTFLILSGIVLGLALFIKYLQLLISEFLQRHLAYRELSSWEGKVPHEKQMSPYFFEIFSLLKSFTDIVTSGSDLFLRALFGILALAFIHPAFLVISFLFVLSLVPVVLLGRGAIRSALAVSDQKYRLYREVKESESHETVELMTAYMRERDGHFRYLKRQSLAIYASYFVLQLLLLAWGIRLVQSHQLSIGQLVAAEIILSGILLNYANLPKILTSFYDFEVSCTKIALLKSPGGA